jgi:hypothetical protein
MSTRNLTSVFLRMFPLLSREPTSQIFERACRTWFVPESWRFWYEQIHERYEARPAPEEMITVKKRKMAWNNVDILVAGFL